MKTWPFIVILGLMVDQNLTHNSDLKIFSSVFLVDIHGKKSKSFAKKVQIKKLKNASDKTARLTLKWQKSKLSLKWGHNTNIID